MRSPGPDFKTRPPPGASTLALSGALSAGRAGSVLDGSGTAASSARAAPASAPSGSAEAAGPAGAAGPAWGAAFARSEEHTSELQSRVDLVCRLLLEKKKKQQASVRLEEVAPPRL